MGMINDDFLLEDDEEIVDKDLQDDENQEEVEDVNFEKEDDEEQTEEESSNQSFTENESLNLFLQSKGINPHEIFYENENGEEETVNFYDLDFEEQMNILNYKQDDYDLDEEEINTINFLREHDIDLEEYTEYIKNKAYEEYKIENTQYSVDEYNDDQIYTAFLKNQYENLSDDEIQAEIEKEKENPDRYSKKVEQLRSYYKEQEELELQEEERLKKETEEEELNEIKDIVTKAAVSTNNFMGFEIEDDDRREALRFIFEKDANGKSKFYKMFDDPEKLFRIALFALKEDEIYTTIDKELSKLSKKEVSVPKVNLKQEPKKEKKVVVNSKSSESSRFQHKIEDDILNQLL